MDDLHEIKEEIKHISRTLDRNTATLEVHVLRTEHAEKRLDLLENFNRWFLGSFLLSLLGFVAKLLFK